MTPFAILSASLSRRSREVNEARTRELGTLLRESPSFTGVLPVRGCYVSPVTGDTEHEDSFLVLTPTDGAIESVRELASQFGQEAILLDRGGQGSLQFPDDRVQPLGSRRPGKSQNGWTSTVLGDFTYE